uniref:Uncharacterized protein n=1 Tax=Arundo donax TaxID=35708 RepID=A0A0A9BJ52_ARUDO
MPQIFIRISLVLMLELGQ